MGVTTKELELELYEPCLISAPCVSQVNAGWGFASAAHLSVIESPLVNFTDTCLLVLSIFGASERKKMVGK